MSNNMLTDLQASWVNVAKSISCIAPGVHITSMTIVTVKLVIQSNIGQMEIQSSFTR
jgi:hypothetical protein